MNDDIVSAFVSEFCSGFNFDVFVSSKNSQYFVYLECDGIRKAHHLVFNFSGPFLIIIWRLAAGSFESFKAFQTISYFDCDLLSNDNMLLLRSWFQNFRSRFGGI